MPWPRSRRNGVGSRWSAPRRGADVGAERGIAARAGGWHDQARIVTQVLGVTTTGAGQDVEIVWGNQAVRASVRTELRAGHLEAGSRTRCPPVQATPGPSRPRVT